MADGQTIHAVAERLFEIATGTLKEPEKQLMAGSGGQLDEFNVSHEYLDVAHSMLPVNPTRITPDVERNVIAYLADVPLDVVAFNHETCGRAFRIRKTRLVGISWDDVLRRLGPEWGGAPGDAK